MKIAMLKAGGVLVADNEQAIDVLSRVKEGSHVAVDIKQSRNIKNHRRFFAFLYAVFEMQESFDNLEHLRHWMIMKAGFYDTFVTPSDYTMFLPKSMDFASMDEIVFKDLFSRCIDIAIRGLGLSKDAVDRVIDFS